MIEGSMSRIRFIVLVFVSSALSTIVINRPGPPGKARLIEYRAHQRIASPVMNSPWLSKRIARGLGSASISMRIVFAVVVGSVLDFKRAPADAQGGICPENENAGDARAPSCQGVSFSLLRLSDQSLGFHEMPACVMRECLPGVGANGLRGVFAPGVMKDGGLL